jgi:hypothetical protein
MRQKAGRLLKQQARRVIGLALNERMLSVIRSETAQPFGAQRQKRRTFGGEDEGYFGGLGRKSRIQRLNPDILRC